MQQMQSDDSSDELIITRIGSAVRVAMAAKEDLQHSIAEAIDASTTFGYELGAEDMKLKIIKAFQDSGSASSAWAVGIIETLSESKDEL